MTDAPQWTVTMLVERKIAVTVEADSEAEARAKAEDWDILGNEQELDTLEMKIISATKD